MANPLKKKAYHKQTDYDGPSPKCIFCGSEDTSYAKGFYAPMNQMVKMLPENVICVTCKKCGKQFFFDLKTQKEWHKE